jgi:uracil-DNA glycosylase
VPGYGPRQSRRVIVGEAPGMAEVRAGIPFVGRSGIRLNEALVDQGADRSKIYITNTVLCHPPNNRDPSRAEIDACHERLIHEIRETKPGKILALGKIASRAITDDAGPINRMRLLRPAPSPHLDDGEVRVTYHPAALSRNSKWAEQFDDDIGWLAEPEFGESDLMGGHRARALKLVEQGHSLAEIGQILGLDEERIRWLLRDEPPATS